MHLSSKDDKIFIAGHRGLVGSAVTNLLRKRGYSNLALRGRDELDLRSRDEVFEFFRLERPKFVVLAAAKVGGILANRDHPVDFLGQNLSIQQNVIEASHETGVKRLIFLGSSCIYPKEAPQPIKEEYLLSGRLEPTNQWYSIAKIAGLKLCQAYFEQHGDDFLTIMPSNVYGPGDNFDLQSGHVMAALIRKFHEAKSGKENRGRTVTVWGSGKPRREFLFSNDLAEACYICLVTVETRIRDVSHEGIMNVGVGDDVSIRELAKLIQDVVGGDTTIEWDASKPDGTPRKLLDVHRIKQLGWEPSTELREGIALAYDWFKSNY